MQQVESQAEVLLNSHDFKVITDTEVFPITWGVSFPIEKKVNASDDAKASQRAVNLLSMTVPLHVYQTLSNDFGQACDTSAFHENYANTQLQKIYPEPETTCQVFGKTLHYGDSDLIKAAGGSCVWVALLSGMHSRGG